MTLGMKRNLTVSYDEALLRVTEALKAEGFGVLTEIDLQATLKAKIGADIRRSKILGACNPSFAHQALGMNPDVAVFLPCNVVVYEDDAGRTVVNAVDPLQTIGPNAPEMKELAGKVRERLERALGRLT